MVLLGVQSCLRSLCGIWTNVFQAGGSAGQQFNFAGENQVYILTMQVPPLVIQFSNPTPEEFR